MTTVTSEEISLVRDGLASHPEVLSALSVIEECDGNLEDAAEALVVESGVKLDRNAGLDLGEAFLKQVAQKCRNVICAEEFKEELIDGFSRDLMNALLPVLITQLTLMGNLPEALAVPVLMYVLKRGIRKFCNTPDADS
ncbi:hypothetical protein [Calothrix sp. UHCC 0171]|uniref:hypothetical protein n=1 Tax=Calothrix sp. UHCC 0171 TaxID=3110245 RepID=UPI002B20083E|nr:hypothetical protein [Calothrix sp. UHCC 0171]MEA5573407.1 hypothetical protein [Calothrix sp. UHCC 0171]